MSEAEGGVDMGKAPAFQFYAADFLMGTNDMTAEEVGIYIRLLAASWDKGPLPIEPSRLARVAGVDVKRFVKAWMVLCLKWEQTPNGYVNTRLEEQRQERERFAEMQAERGRRSGEARRTKREPETNAGSTMVQPEGQPEMNRRGTLQSSVFRLQTSEDPLTIDPSGGGARAREPRWSRDGRTQSLISNHHLRCYASPACARGVCVPGWLATEWRQQYGDDTAMADVEIGEVITTALAAIPASGPIGDTPKDFWRAVWKAAHGSHAPSSGTARSKGQLTLDAARRFVLSRMQANGVAS